MSDHNKKEHAFGALYGSVQLVVAYREDPTNMLVCFATEKEMLRAKTAFEQAHGCNIPPEETESFSGCHAFWMPVKMRMMNEDGTNPSIIKTAESTFLEKQMHLARIHFMLADDIKDLHSKLNRGISQLVAARNDKNWGHTLN